MQRTQALESNWRCGPDRNSLTSQTYHAAGTRPLKFEATENIAARGVELRFRAITPDLPLAIRNLIVELTSEAVAASQMPAALRLDDWLPFLSIGTSGRRVGRHVVAEPVRAAMSSTARIGRSGQGVTKCYC